MAVGRNVACANDIGSKDIITRLIPYKLSEERRIRKQTSVKHKMLSFSLNIIHLVANPFHIAMLSVLLVVEI